MDRRGHFRLDFPWWFTTIVFILAWPLWVCDKLGLNLGAYWWVPLPVYWCVGFGILLWYWRRK